jgi:hypothetical protein
MTSKERFEAWREANAKYIEPADFWPWIEEAWVQAEAQAVRRCVEWIDAWSVHGDRVDNMKNSIKQEFPEAFK